MASRLSAVQFREMFWIGGPAILLIWAAFWLAYQFVEPAPPQSIKISTGGKTGAYYAVGKRYESILARSGVTLEVLQSAGSVENLARLRDKASGVSVALLQGGIANAKSAPELLSLGRIFLEPLWVFYRGDATVERLSELKGKRIAIGPVGSGTRQLAIALLDANGVTPDTAELGPGGDKAAVDALRKSEVDAIFLVVAPQAQLIQQLLKSENIRLMSFSRAKSYSRIFPFLSPVVLPEGVVDLVKNIPNKEITLLAASATLLMRNDLHPALAGLLAEAAVETHGHGGLFQRIGEFPNAADPEFMVSPDALRIYKSGPPFLQRFLPFWIASFIERMVILAVPIATILLPLFKFVPWLYRWRIRKRILHWYAQLKALEQGIVGDPAGAKFTTHLGEIERIDEAVGNIPIPIGYSDQFYDLRSAIDLVRQRLKNFTQIEAADLATAQQAVVDLG